jgi:hypothetical protein
MMSFRRFVGTSSNAIWRLINDLGVDANAICMHMQDWACLVPEPEKLECFQMSEVDVNLHPLLHSVDNGI